ncbi:hypothetical protein VC83_03807 [Pseudogymnoascus destructans]|uniref:Uncharacterized protein n=2 Tax=Pseudogymnoascus destructans TaxID=655981 RepID=L8FXA2_PSED2|nr:uncharacterized protein VC83_03807 [Pseudogymnoascus destructans]ELR05164.1 hypothetical protein GMDG_07205 [Pseudogymnoascus destructans 20631-21]OAF59582.1 hypothetical protein VC83_03807 [Pseudogymnoascus destructans]
MPPTNLLPLPYLLAVQLLSRDMPDDTTGEVPNIEPEPVPPYKYPSWAFGIGTLVVFVICIFFAFTCAGINRRLNRKALLRAEFPCLGANMGPVSCLATSSSNAAAAFVMPGHAEEVRTLSPMEEQKKVVDLKVVKINMKNLKMPAALPKVFRKLGRKRERGEVVADDDVELIQLSSVKGKSGLVPKGGRWTLDKQGTWVWEEGGGKNAGLTGKGDHMLVEAYAGRDDEDSIGFVTTEERFENVDTK